MGIADLKIIKMWGTERTRYLKTDQNYSAIRLTCLCSWNTWLIIKNQNITKDFTGLIHTSYPLHRGEIRALAYVLLRIAEEIIIYKLVRFPFSIRSLLITHEMTNERYQFLDRKRRQDFHFHPSTKSWISKTFKEKKPKNTTGQFKKLADRWL